MLGDVLRDLRKKGRMTQEGVAKKLGIPRSTYSNYESGKREPDLKTIKEIADLYNVTISDLTEQTKSNINKFSQDVDLYNIEDVIVKYNLKIDGKAMTVEEARGFLAFVRMNRSTE